MKSFLFKEFLLKRVISGHKTETRRSHGLETVNKHPASYDLVQMTEYSETGEQDYNFMPRDQYIERPGLPFPINRLLNSPNIFVHPKYNVGEIAYLKENYTDLPDGTFVYQIDTPVAERKNYKWKSKLMMPASKARHFVKITAIDCHQIQDISETSAIAEGIQELLQSRMQLIQNGALYLDYEKPVEFLNEGIRAKDSFRSLWKLVNGDQSWIDNTWVFAYTFEYLPNYKIS